MLLSLKANPWSNETTSYRDICSDSKCIRFLNKARQVTFYKILSVKIVKISVLQAFSRFRNDQDFWEKASENAFPPPIFYES